MPLSAEQDNFLCDIEDAEPGSLEEKKALAFIQKNPIEFEDDQFYWTPLITAISRKRPRITQELLAKKANIFYVTGSGSTALSAAIKAQDQPMIDFLTPHYKAHFGEDRIIIDELTALMDNYYPAACGKDDAYIRDHRAQKMPVLQQYRNQPEPLSAAVIQYLRKNITKFQALIRERDLVTQKRDMEARRYEKPEEQKAYWDLSKAARLAELEVHNQLVHEKADLEKKLREEELGRKALEERHKQLEDKMNGNAVKVEDLSGRLKGLEVKMNVLWLKHETEASIAREKAFIRSREQVKLKIFYDRMRRKLNDIFLGGQAERSGAVVVKDRAKGPAKAVGLVIELVGKLIPFPFVDKAAALTSLLLKGYLSYKQKKQAERAHAGLTRFAAEGGEWNEEIVDPVARRLSLLGVRQLPQFGDKDIELLAEYSVVLILFYLIYEHDPRKIPAPDYTELVQALLLAVRFQHSATADRTVKDNHGESVKAPWLSRSLGGRVSKVSAVDVLRAFEDEVPAGLIPLSDPVPASCLAPATPPLARQPLTSLAPVLARVPAEGPLHFIA